MSLNIFFDTNMAGLVTEMINHYIPVDEDGSSNTRERVMKEYQVYAQYFLSCLFVLCSNTTV